MALSLRTYIDSQSPGDGPGARRAAAQDTGAADFRVGRAVLGGLCQRRNHGGPARGRHRVFRADANSQSRHHRVAGRRRHQLYRRRSWPIRPGWRLHGGARHLGEVPAQAAGAALLVDYVLTVAAQLGGRHRQRGLAAQATAGVMWTNTRAHVSGAVICRYHRQFARH